MLEKDRLGVAPRVYFRPEFKSCPHCETKLRRTHTAWEKKIVTRWNHPCQPEKGNETLYVLREVFSGTVLTAQNMKSGTAEELKTLTQEEYARICDIERKIN
ncbi:hypothetical protein GC093_29215 [Paenibacillus sp. LMG 31456]|uniref:Uncharacterized protein n=1 Tax=Paenibacillus foliorum TaxID=2654974 RepID=A0A972H004_9BACL|nr:hypothetical protein [Paenibacillus foliorum]NOU97278.1 hypothetical protein [Paenibacillus foliorum]